MRTETMQGQDWSLPLFITQANKKVVLLFCWVVACAMYLLSNHFPIFTPRMLPMSWIDQAVPFVPETVWIYNSEYLLFLAVYFMARNMDNLSRYVYAFMSMQTVSILIFMVWPTTFPRDLFPLPVSLDFLTHNLFSNLRVADSPNNCFPSLHVSSVFLSSFVYLNEQKNKFPFFFAWAAAIGVSTLTTKQHYLIDVLAGLAMAIIFYWLFYRVIPYRRGLQAKR